MLWSKLINRLGQFDRLHSIELHGQSDVWFFSLLTLKWEKGTVSILEKKSGQGIEELKALLTVGIPWCLTISGDEVLFKHEPDHAKETAFSTLFPGAKEEDFLISTCRGAQGYCVSAFRLTSWESLQHELGSFKNELINVQLGPSALLAASNYIPDLDIQSTNLKISHGDIQENYTSSTTTYTEDRIESTYILCWALGVDSWIRQTCVSNLQNHWLENTQGIRASILQKKLIVYGPIILFAIVLVNHFVYQSQLNENIKLKSELQSVELKLNELSRLETERDVFLELSSLSGQQTSTPIASVLDSIGMSVPPTIQLDQLTLNPLKIKSNGIERSLKDFGAIILSGTAGNAPELSEWIRELESYQFVSTLELNEYEVKEGRGLFRVKLTLSK